MQRHRVGRNLLEWLWNLCTMTVVLTVVAAVVSTLLWILRAILGPNITPEMLADTQLGLLFVASLVIVLRRMRVTDGKGAGN